MNPETRELLGALRGPKTRREAVRQLSELKDPEAVPALLEILLGDEVLNLDAAEILGEIGDNRAVPALLQVLSSQELRQTFDQHIKDAQQAGTLGAILAVIETTGMDIYLRRQAAAIALGKIGDSKAIPGLIELVEDRRNLNEMMNTSWTVLAGIEALGQFTTDEAIKYLNSLLDDNTILRVSPQRTIALVAADILKGTQYRESD
jgi:HEAT repeat protein